MALNRYRMGFLVAGPLAALLMLLGFDLQPGQPQVTAMAAVAIWMALWWIGEAVPLAVTALLPLVLFPLLGIMNGKSAASAYVNHIIFLFIGGFLVALAMQKWQVHRRIALRILMVFGRGPGMVLLGFMLTTGFLSMWISNTATAMMMVPVAMAVAASLDESLGEQVSRRFAVGLLLAIAYSASIGGISTLIGTPPNLSFVRILSISFADAPEISFARWLFFALPISLAMFAACWVLLYGLFVRGQPLRFEPGYFAEQYRSLGVASREQKMILAAFLAMAVLWIFRADIRLGVVTIPGWSNLFANPKFINDGTVAIAVALLLFLLPSREPGQKLLDGEVFSQLPWHIILLFGGGFALASGFVQSGLSVYLADQLQGFDELNPLLLIAAICLLVTFLTELTSNTATTEMLLPVLAAMAVAFQVNPLLLMIPATLSASCAFMLPVATPPNAIVFGTNRLHVYQMARTGIGLNLLGALLITLAAYYWAPWVFDFEARELPSWAVLAVEASH